MKQLASMSWKGVHGSVTLVAALAATWACKSTPSGMGSGCGSTNADVIINALDNLAYDKPNVTVTRQQRICWQTTGAVTHTVTADFNPSDTTWKLNGRLDPGLAVVAVFDTTGDYFYHCSFHATSNNMRGVIHVR